MRPPMTPKQRRNLRRMMRRYGLVPRLRPVQRRSGRGWLIAGIVCLLGLAAWNVLVLTGYVGT